MVFTRSNFANIFPFRRLNSFDPMICRRNKIDILNLAQVILESRFETFGERVDSLDFEAEKKRVTSRISPAGGVFAARIVNPCARRPTLLQNVGGGI